MGRLTDGGRDRKYGQSEELIGRDWRDVGTGEGRETRGERGRGLERGV